VEKNFFFFRFLSRRERSRKEKRENMGQRCVRSGKRSGAGIVELDFFNIRSFRITSVMPTAETRISPEMSDKLIISLNKKFLGNLPNFIHWWEKERK
jgi:hypothetical protein